MKVNIQDIIWGLEELADKELQEKLWLGKLEGQMSTPEEVICRTFDDSHLGRLLYFGRTTDQMSHEALEKLSELSQAVNALPINSSPSEVIHHPTMEEVRILAQEALTLLQTESQHRGP